MARITLEVIQHYNVVQNFLPDLGEAAEKAGVSLPEELKRFGNDGPWFHAVTSANGVFLRFAEKSFGISFPETEITGTPGEVLSYRYYEDGVLAVTGVAPNTEDVIVLKEGEKFVSDRKDPYGFALVYETDRLQVEQTSSGARIHLEYRILSAGQVLEDNEVILEVNE